MEISNRRPALPDSQEPEAVNRLPEWLEKGWEEELANAEELGLTEQDIFAARDHMRKEAAKDPQFIQRVEDSHRRTIDLVRAMLDLPPREEPWQPE